MSCVGAAVKPTSLSEARMHARVQVRMHSCMHEPIYCR